jgi:hypothetical protein
MFVPLQEIPMKQLSHALLAAAMIVGMTAVPAVAHSRTSEPEKPHHSLGVMVSNIAGSGLTYQHRFDSGWGFHVSGIGWSQGGSAFYNFGGAVTKDFVEREWGALYGLAAVGYGVDMFSGFAGPSGTRPGANIQSNFAPGIGLRYHMLQLELGYSIFANASGPGFTPAGGGGLFFHF